MHASPTSLARGSLAFYGQLHVRTVAFKRYQHGRRPPHWT